MEDPGVCPSDSTPIRSVSVATLIPLTRCLLCTRMSVVVRAGGRPDLTRLNCPHSVSDSTSEDTLLAMCRCMHVMVSRYWQILAFCSTRVPSQAISAFPCEFLHVSLAPSFVFISMFLLTHSSDLRAARTRRFTRVSHHLDRIAGADFTASERSLHARTTPLAHQATAKTNKEDSQLPPIHPR